MDTLQRQLSARWWRSLSKADRWALGVIVGLPIIVFAIPALLGYPAIAQDNLIQNFPLRALVAVSYTHLHGDARGREIGFPTANLFFSERQVVPALGIYAGAVLLEGARWVPGAISVGTRPQFYEQGEVLVEVHIPNFDADILSLIHI